MKKNPPSQLAFVCSPPNSVFEKYCRESRLVIKNVIRLMRFPKGHKKHKKYSNQIRKIQWRMFNIAFPYSRETY
jgi:hypothetical protein